MQIPIITRSRILTGLLVVTMVCTIPALQAAEPKLIRSARSGPWSAEATWEGGNVPARHARVQVREGHTVLYDVTSGPFIRSIHVAGTLTFARDKDTELTVGLIKIQAGDNASEHGFDCDAHVADPDPAKPRPALEVGTFDQPIPAKYKALIRLIYIQGMDKENCPAIICCGGRMDFHGAPMSRTWVKLGATAKKGEKDVTLTEPVTGWRVRDRVLVTATSLSRDDSRGDMASEQNFIQAIDGNRITLDSPLVSEHLGIGSFRGEVANLSRNVIVESAGPSYTAPGEKPFPPPPPPSLDEIKEGSERGHTMYHRNSTGSISYAEFRHLGKVGVLGKYPLHFHLCGDTMRGSFVQGASIWGSGNRWLTIHGTNYLVVRDCVGHYSIGHGYFLEDGTEAYNVLDRNLAVGAWRGKPLPKQVLAFDRNEGAGFWWANSLNSFTRNVTCENERYGYRFEATQTSRQNLTLPVMQPDGKRQPTDIRTLPFVRFEDNESHCDGLYGFNLGEGVNRVGPDAKHPFVIRNMKIWAIHYAFRPQSPSVLTENMVIHRAAYGVYHPNYDRHVYQNLTISETDTEPFNRGHDDISAQYGVLTVDGLTFSGNRNSGMPLIQISDDNPTGEGETHMRNVKVTDRRDGERRALVNLGGGPRPTPKTPKGVPIYLHDYYGAGRHAKVVSTRAKDLINDGNKYHEQVPLTGNESRVAEVRDISFPKLLDPVDDLPPATVITSVQRTKGKLIVRGTTSDNGTVKKVLVNGQEARALAGNFAEWEITLDDTREIRLEAHAVDTAGNAEKRPHVLVVK